MPLWTWLIPALEGERLDGRLPGHNAQLLEVPSLLTKRCLPERLDRLGNARLVRELGQRRATPQPITGLGLTRTDEPDHPR